jgi:hypothetical protein
MKGFPLASRSEKPFQQNEKLTFRTCMFDVLELLHYFSKQLVFDEVSVHKLALDFKLERAPVLDRHRSIWKDYRLEQLLQTHESV